MTDELRADLVVIMLPTTRLEESVPFLPRRHRASAPRGMVGRGPWRPVRSVGHTARVELVEMAAVPEVDEPRTTIGLKITGVDEVHARLTAFGAKIKAPPRTRAWGMYGFGAFDPNGVPINVYEPAG